MKRTTTDFSQNYLSFGQQNKKIDTDVLNDGVIPTEGSSHLADNAPLTPESARKRAIECFGKGDLDALVDLLKEMDRHDLHSLDLSNVGYSTLTTNGELKLIGDGSSQRPGFTIQAFNCLAKFFGERYLSVGHLKTLNLQDSCLSELTPLLNLLKELNEAGFLKLTHLNLSEVVFLRDSNGNKLAQEPGAEDALKLFGLQAAHIKILIDLLQSPNSLEYLGLENQPAVKKPHGTPPQAILVSLLQAMKKNPGLELNLRNCQLDDSARFWIEESGVNISKLRLGNNPDLEKLTQASVRERAIAYLKSGRSDHFKWLLTEMQRQNISVLDLSEGEFGLIAEDCLIGVINQLKSERGYFPPVLILRDSHWNAPGRLLSSLEGLPLKGISFSGMTLPKPQPTVAATGSGYDLDVIETSPSPLLFFDFFKELWESCKDLCIVAFNSLQIGCQNDDFRAFHAGASESVKALLRPLVGNRLKVLELRGCGLQRGDMRAIADTFAHLKALECLDLRGNSFRWNGHDTLDSFLKGFTAHPTLQRLLLPSELMADWEGLPKNTKDGFIQFVKESPKLYEVLPFGNDIPEIKAILASRQPELQKV